MKVYELIEKLQSLDDEDKQLDVMAESMYFNLYDIVNVGMDFAKCGDDLKPVIAVDFEEEDLS